ncbi:MAG: DUF2029 domain-containing protein [Actinobacteria bacterium]|nr:DUF2029 domain-containing protein [Actinomycetota bacterium]
MSTRSASWFRRADPPAAALATVVAVAGFFVSWIVLHHGIYTRDQVVDTPVYKKYGDWMAEGLVPYRDFRPEYPPGALPVFVLPSLPGEQPPTFERYRSIFEGLMAACGAAALALMGWTLWSLGAGSRRLALALGFAALAPLAVGSVVLSRFDLWPAALTAAALAAFVAGRDRTGAAVLGVAVAAKIYPGVLVPLLGVWLWRRRGRPATLACAGIFAAVVAACFVPFLALAPDGVAASLGRQLSRPLQIESLGAAALLAADHLGGAAVTMESSHGSQNVAGTRGDVVGILQTLVQALVLVGVWVMFARGDMTRERLIRFAAASVVAFVAFGKVLSPQFLIWLVPLVPLVAGRRGFAASGLLAVSLVLTQSWFPFRYWDYALTFDETVSWVVLARDLVLVATLAALVWSAGDGRQRAT